MSENGTIEIVVNGDGRTIEAGHTVKSLVEWLERD